MTRISGTTTIFVCLAFLLSTPPATAQSDQGASCFPWQELQDGRCVAKASPSEPPELPSAASTPCEEGVRNLSRRCACPVTSHLDTASGKCVADAAPFTKSLDAPPPPEAKAADVKPADVKAADPETAAHIRCDGGSVRDGNCACPAGFGLRPVGGNTGGACVRTDAENCQGGELTASGACLCNGQVVMSGETYLMEYANGKCLPKRCPVETTLKEGRCVVTSAVTATPAAKEKPASPKESRQETSDKDEPRRRCAHGMIRTRAGCVEARRRTSGKYDNPEARFRRYYRLYDYPGYAIGLPPY